MIGAGELRDRITFERRGLDENQDPLGPWEEVLTVWARLVWLRGGEGVQAQRLEGKQPVVITIRASSDSRAINTGWRAVDARNADHRFNITAVSPAREAGFLDILAVMGGATG